MLRILVGVFILLHGLVHLWYFTLSQSLVAFQPEMGWTGRSWLLSRFVQEPTLRPIASTLYVLAAMAFILGSPGVFTGAAWMRPVLIGAAIFSSTVILLFWDGSGEMLVQKGVLGLAINLAILAVLLVFQ
jgi:hypothetical protein